MFNADAVVHGSSNPLLAAEITFGCLLWPGDVFVDFDNNLNTAVGRLREALGDSAEHPHFIETLPKRGYRFIASVTRPSAGETSAGRVKLAVLPFANLSGDPAQEYFSDGITEELISRLAELAPKHLGVIARTTAMHYKGSRKDIAEIGRDLGLDYVLEGSARREGDQARVTVQLIQVSDQTQVWSKDYGFELRHALKLQSGLAGAVAERIKVILPARGTPERILPVDPEAHDAYLNGLYHFSRYNPVAFERATECFQLAVRKDPGYAAAYAKLALCYSFAGYFGYSAPFDAYPQAEAAAVKTLERLARYCVRRKPRRISTRRSASHLHLSSHAVRVREPPRANCQSEKLWAKPRVCATNCPSLSGK